MAVHIVSGCICYVRGGVRVLLVGSLGMGSHIRMGLLEYLGRKLENISRTCFFSQCIFMLLLFPFFKLLLVIHQPEHSPVQIQSFVFSSRGAWTVKQIGHLPWLHSDDTGCVVKSSCSPMKRANGLIDWLAGWLAGWHSHTRDGSGSSSSSGKKRFLGGCPPVQSSPVAGE